jgi:hypothetical protein
MPKGYDNLPMLFQSVLDIPMYEGIGALAHDIARPPAITEDHTMALHGATIGWAQWPLSNVTIIDFTDATPDYLSLAAAESLSMDYQVGAFSGVAWIHPDIIAPNARFIICKGGTGAACGWDFIITAAGAICFSTVQAGDSQHTYSPDGAIVISEWAMIGFTRLGAAAKVYKNGVDVTSIPDTHVDPDSAAADDVHIGVTNLHALPYDGYIWRPRIFSRELSAIDMQQIFEVERDLVGV